MAEIVWNPKDPDETVAFHDDWTDELGDDTVASWDFTITSGTATISQSKLSGNEFRYWIAGGTNGETCTFQNEVTTGSGQVLLRTFSLTIATDADSFRPATTTKRQLVEQMFNECAINGWEYDITAEEKDTALTRLDALMWELRGRGIDVNYNFPLGIGRGDLDDVLGCPDQAFFGLAILGAERLCPTMGKTQSRESRMALTSAMKAVRSAAPALVPSMDLAPGTPIGSGNKSWSTRYPFSMTS